MNTNPTGTVEQRFWRNVDASAGVDGCWPWLGYHDNKGYGQLAYNGQRARHASRLSLELAGMPVPRGLLVLHSCDNPPCVNPAHLRVGTQSDNLRDMYARGRQPAHLGRQTVCRRGHPLIGVNEIVRSDGYHQCRTCRNAASHRRFGASAERSDPRSLTPSGVGPVDRSAESLRSDSGPVGRVRG